MSRRIAAALLVGGLASAPSARAQWSLSNLMEARVGKDPDDVLLPDSRYTLFEQFDLQYFRDNLQLGLRYETFLPSEDVALEYSELVHRFAAWNSRWVDARIGNFEALFGRGVVLRAFELPGVVREELGRQFGDSRDMDGVRVRLHHHESELVFVSGKPRRADAPPDAERRGLVTGLMAASTVVRGLRPGAEYLRLDTQGQAGDPGNTSEVTGGFVQLGWDPWLERLGAQARLGLGSYVEYTRATGLGETLSSKVDPGEGYGLYLQQDVVVQDLLGELRTGLSWEYKDYQNFDLEPAGVNEPPSLVREHAYALLNRNTHVVEPKQEEGYQLEASLDYGGHADLTLNWSRAENQYTQAVLDTAGSVIAPPRPQRFYEFYAELAGHLRGGTLSLFADDSQDGAAGLYERQTFGTYGLLPVRGPHSLQVEYAQMTALRRSSLGDEDFKDNYLALTWAWAGLLSLTGIRQTTDDPADAGAPDPETGSVRRRVFASLSGSLQIAAHHELVVFWGTRRGGIACTAGTCYLLPAFEGVSMRLNSRF